MADQNAAALTKFTANKVRVELSREPPSTFKGFRPLEPEEVDKRRQRFAAYDGACQRQRATRPWPLLVLPRTCKPLLNTVRTQALTQQAS